MQQSASVTATHQQLSHLCSVFRSAAHMLQSEHGRTADWSFKRVGPEPPEFRSSEVFVMQQPEQTHRQKMFSALRTKQFCLYSRVNDVSAVNWASEQNFMIISVMSAVLTHGSERFVFCVSEHHARVQFCRLFSRKIIFVFCWVGRRRHKNNNTKNINNLNDINKHFDWQELMSCLTWREGRVLCC